MYLHVVLTGCSPDNNFLCLGFYSYGSFWRSSNAFTTSQLGFGGMLIIINNFANGIVHEDFFCRMHFIKCYPKEVKIYSLQCHHLMIVLMSWWEKLVHQDFNLFDLLLLLLPPLQPIPLNQFSQLLFLPQTEICVQVDPKWLTLPLSWMIQEPPFW